MSFQNDFDWQLQFLPTIRNIVGPHLLEQAPFEIDAKQATDMLVLMARDMRIACRVRRAGYADRYPFEFTVRSRRDNGAKTELTKLIEGWGDWMLYAHAEHNDLPSFARWYLIDLAAWRAQMINTNKKAGKPQNKSNGDGTHFVAFDVRHFEERPQILVASSHEVFLI